MLCLCLCAGAEGMTISGCAFVDSNRNGTCDSGETLMTGVPVTLLSETADGWQTAAQTETDAYGQYAFAGLTEGRYRVRCKLNDLTLVAASVGGASEYEDGAVYAELEESAQADIALQEAALLCVEAYQDSNFNGLRGEYERDLSGVRVEILSGESVLADGVTDKKGTLTLCAPSGEYTLRFTLAEHYAFSPLGEDNCATSDTSEALAEAVRLTAGETTRVSIGARAVGSFSGKAFEDMNNNGVMDEGEPGAAGVTVRLSGERTGTKRETVTDENGEYRFDRLPDDLYTVTAELPEGMLFARYSKTGGDLRSIFTGSTLSRSFSVKSAEHVTNKNIGVVQKGAISGTAFLDLNYNGLWDEGETGYAGVTVEAIKISSGESVAKTVTAEDGSFRLENLRGGDYRLRAVLPDDGSVFSQTAEETPEQGNCFEQRTGRRESSVQPLTIESGGEAAVLIGVARGASVSGTVFQDADYNGRMNGKEKALSGVKVRAVDENGQVVAEDATGSKGQYTLSGIMPGVYTIQVQRKSDFGFTRLRPEEKSGSYIAALEGDWGVTEPMSIAMGESLTEVNAGMLPSATVSGFFFHDANDNGLWDAGELGMQGAQVRLLSEDGEIDLVQHPAADGSYFFDGVMPGKYTLSYLLPEHTEMARVEQGGNTVKHQGAQTVTETFRIEMGEKAQMPLAGAVTLGSFEGFVFQDGNADDVMDEGEAPLAGAKITLGSVSAESAADGSFSITGLRPSDYNLTIALPDGYIFSHNLSADALILNPVSEQTLVCPWAALVSREDKLIGAVRPAAVSGVIWMDENKDGVRAEDEWIMEGLSLSLTDEATGMVVASTVSDSEGFRFENVRPSRYIVRFALPEQSAPADAPSGFILNGAEMEQHGVEVKEGTETDGLSAGLVSRTSIGGTVYLDENGERTTVAGAQVALMQNGRTVQTVTTGEDGAYRFDGLWPDTYVLRAELPQGMIFVRPNDSGYPQNASVIADTDSGESGVIRLKMAQHQLSCDILCIKPAKVGDLVWLDENGNGLVDGEERRLSGVTIRLVQNGQTVYETVSGAEGYYLFENVYPGEYVLEASAWTELEPTQTVPELRIISSCLTGGDGLSAHSDAFRVESGANHFNQDIGYVLREGCELPAEAQSESNEKDWTRTHY